MPNLQDRFGVISFRDGQGLFHRATERIPIKRKGEDFKNPHHFLLAFRGFQGHQKRPFSYGSD
jgi:hypothetical protein